MRRVSEFPHNQVNESTVIAFVKARYKQPRGENDELYGLPINSCFGL